MDMHIHDRFREHRALRRDRVPFPGPACHVTVVTRGRQRWFEDFHVACEAVRSFRQPAVLEDASLLAWVLMPDHAHWLIEPGPGAPLEKVVSRMKAATGVQVNRMLARAGPLWAPAFHDHLVGGGDDLRTVARRIVANPLRDGLVDRIGDYPFWDSVWL